MIDNIPSIYNQSSIYKQQGISENDPIEGVIFKTNCDNFDGSKDVPIIGVCRDFSTLQNGFNCTYASGAYKFTASQAASESGDVWWGAPMAIFTGKKIKCKVKCALGGNKSRTWQILTPLPVRITFWDDGLVTNEKNSIGVNIYTTLSYTTSSHYYWNNGTDKHIALQPLIIDKYYDVFLTFDNGHIRIDIDGEFVEFDYDHFIPTSPSWIGAITGGFAVRQNSSTVNTTQTLNIKELLVWAE